MNREVNYNFVAQRLVALTDGIPYEIANLANASALLWQHMADINWVGFYKMTDGILVLGPFQGKPPGRFSPGDPGSHLHGQGCGPAPWPGLCGAGRCAGSLCPYRRPPSAVVFPGRIPWQAGRPDSAGDSGIGGCSQTALI